MPHDSCACFAAEPGPAEAIAGQLLALTRRHFERRIAAVRAAIDAAEEFDGAARRLLTAGAGWSGVALATVLGEAMELAAWSGREEAFLDEEASFATEVVGQSFREQIDFLRQKRPKPTRVWTDALHGDHDRAFVVAGAIDTALLEEFQQAVIRAAEGGGYRRFAADFDRIVERSGWSYNGGREWRIRTIYQTNLRTSHMAGRLRQMRDPDVLRNRPFWQYVHAESRVPRSPRPQHVAWNGLVLRHDDPWWDVYFPPNDWTCSCGVRSLSDRDLRRLGKAGPDAAPPIVRAPYVHQASGVTYMLPEGTGYGWDYMPGDKWERGLVPSALVDEAGGLSTGRQKVEIDTPEPVEDLVRKAHPFRTKMLPPGLSDEDYAKAFLDPFGAAIGRAVRWQDRTGLYLPVSDLFLRERGSGEFKATKRGRGPYMPLLAETLMDPDEIWMGVAEKPVLAGDRDGPQELFVDRRYVRVAADTGLLVVVQMGRLWWEEVTVHPLLRNGKPTLSGLDARRGGKLLWKRK